MKRIELANSIVTKLKGVFTLSNDLIDELEKEFKHMSKKILDKFNSQLGEKVEKNNQVN